MVWCWSVNGEYDDFVIRGVICGKYDSFFEFYGGRNKRYLCKFGVYLIFFEIGCWYLYFVVCDRVFFVEFVLE